MLNTLAQGGITYLHLTSIPEVFSPLAEELCSVGMLLNSLSPLGLHFLSSSGGSFHIFSSTLS